MRAILAKTGGPGPSLPVVSLVYTSVAGVGLLAGWAASMGGWRCGTRVRGVTAASEAVTVGVAGGPR